MEINKLLSLLTRRIYRNCERWIKFGRYRFTQIVWWHSSTSNNSTKLRNYRGELSNIFNTDHNGTNTTQLNINRTWDEELWNLARLLTIIKCEINTRQKCTTTAIEQESVEDVFSLEEPLSAASLFTGQKSKLLCVFCKKTHWSEKCGAISDPSSRKQFLKHGGYCFLCLKEDHKIRDCKKKKSCF